jgi:hypothetical protein
VRQRTPDPYLLTVALSAVRPIISSVYTVESCVLSTRMAVDIARRYGVDAYPLSVEALVMNPIMARLDADHGPTPDRSGWAAQGAAMVWLGKGDEAPQPGKWPGHLVAVIDRRWLLDLSADQAHRPQYDIHLTEPLVFPVTEGFLRGRQDAVLDVQDGEQGAGQRLVYHTTPGNDTWRTSDAWTMREHTDTHVTDVCARAVTELLAATAMIQDMDERAEAIERLGRTMHVVVSAR